MSFHWRCTEGKLVSDMLISQSSVEHEGAIYEGAEGSHTPRFRASQTVFEVESKALRATLQSATVAKSHRRPRGFHTHISKAKALAKMVLRKTAFLRIRALNNSNTIVLARCNQNHMGDGLPKSPSRGGDSEGGTDW